MERLFSTVLLSALYAALCFSQIEVKRERVFAGDELCGYINGGADLYYEYGFQELVTRDIVYKGEEFTVDVFTMDSPLTAFGIYSVLVGDCSRIDSLGRFDCLSEHQLQAVDGNNYVSIVSRSGSAAARKAADELYRIFVSDGHTGIRLPAQLTHMVRTFSGTVKYMRGRTAVSHVNPSLLELLEGIDNFEVWHVENADQNNLALFLLQSSRNSSLLQRRIPRENIIRRGELFVMMKIILILQD